MGVFVCSSKGSSHLDNLHIDRCGFGVSVVDSKYNSLQNCEISNSEKVAVGVHENSSITIEGDKTTTDNSCAACAAGYVAAAITDNCQCQTNCTLPTSSSSHGTPDCTELDTVGKLIHGKTCTTSRSTSSTRVTIFVISTRTGRTNTGTI